MHFKFIYILFSVVHMSLVKQCIFLCTLRSICYVQINIIITTHCDFLSTINSSLPMDIALEKRCSKFYGLA